MCDVKKTNNSDFSLAREFSTTADPTAILRANFKPGAVHACNCGGRACPRRIHSATGLLLGAGLVIHFWINALGLWPSRYQSAVDSIHSLGPVLPWTGLALIFVPLTVHVVMGINFLRKSGLKYGVPGHHHGSDTRYWLQRLSAIVLLFFIVFHVVSLHPWGMGMFKPSEAYESTAHAVGGFWGQAEGSHPANLLIAQFYLLGIAAAIFHCVNGIATGAEVLNLTPTGGSQSRLWKTCIISGLGLMCVGLAAWSAFAVRT